MDGLIKCVIWDLDNTVWEGVLSEGDVFLKPGIKELMETFDERGILQSIASRNNHDDAFAKLKSLGLDHYFLYPQINWGDKSGSIETIRKSLNIGINTLAFIDDQPMEREEVQQRHPEVYCLDSAGYLTFHEDKRFIPERVTEDSRQRRIMYQQDIARTQEEERYPESNLEFLKTLDMELLISLADETDLARAEELTIRTNQLNATGKIYGYDDLHALLNNDSYRLVLCELKDRFGTYGKIGLILLSVREEELHIEIMLFSCRVMSRGIGTVMLHYLHQKAEAKAQKLTASFKDTGRNRVMYMTYRMAGFEETSEVLNGCSVLEFKPSVQVEMPSYIKITDTTKI
jgi:FkbH-like protein